MPATKIPMVKIQKVIVPNPLIQDKKESLLNRLGKVAKDKDKKDPTVKVKVKVKVKVMGTLKMAVETQIQNREVLLMVVERAP